MQKIMEFIFEKILGIKPKIINFHFRRVCFDKTVLTSVFLNNAKRDLKKDYDNIMKDIDKAYEKERTKERRSM